MNDHWQVIFEYSGNGLNCSLNLKGRAQAIAAALSVGLIPLEAKIREMLTAAPPKLIGEALILNRVINADIEPYSGEYLTVKNLPGKSSGLESSISIEWKE